MHALAGSFSEIPRGHSRYQGFFSPRQKNKPLSRTSWRHVGDHPRFYRLDVTLVGLTHAALIAASSPDVHLPVKACCQLSNWAHLAWPGSRYPIMRRLEKNMLWKETLGYSNNPSSHLLSWPGVKQVEAGLFEIKCASRSIRGDIFPSFYLADTTQRTGIIIFA